MQRSARVLMVAGLALTLLSGGGAAGAAGAGGSDPFDGRWIADVPPQLDCSSSRLTLDVRGGSIVGNVVNSTGVYAVAGEVDPDGSGVIRIGQVGGVIRFARGRFIADYDNLRCGPRRAVGVRAG